MANLKDFVKGWKKFHDLTEIVSTLDKVKGEPSAFASHHSDFLSFMKSEYELKAAQLNLLNQEGIAPKIAFAEMKAYEIHKDLIKTSRDDISDISVDLGTDLEKFAFSIVPLRDVDSGKTGKLDDVVTDYTNKAIEKRNELTGMNRADNPDAYEAIEELAKEYEGFSRLITDYKPLVRDIGKYRELVSHLSSDNGRPDTGKLKELYDGYLDKLGKARGLNKYDKMVLKVAKTLSNNENYLPSFYITGLVKPSEKKIKRTVADNHYDLKAYLDRTVGAMNTNKAGGFFNSLYAKKAA